MLNFRALQGLRRACAAVVSIAIGLPASKLVALWRPSLLLRVLFTATATAFALVWCALMAYGYHEATDVAVRDKQYRAFGDGLLQSLPTGADPAQARSLVAAFVERMNDNRRLADAPGEIQMRLLDRSSGATVYASGSMNDPHWYSGPAALYSAHVGTQKYHFYFGQTPRWRLQIASPEPSTAWLLWRLAKNLLPNLLIAFPLVVLPLWLAANYGLQPLQQLGEQIATRSADDASNLKLHTVHAELNPLVNAINGLAAKLTQKMQRERAFVQDAAHELRTPLAVVAAQAHVLAKSELAAARQQAETQLQDAIARASHLVQQLLALSAVDADRPPVLETVDLAQMIRDHLAQRASLVSEPPIELSLEAPDQCLQRVDRLAVQSVLSNLLDNAIRYGHPPGEAGHVVTRLQTTAKQWQLEVTDDGPGIPLSERQRVFERFYRSAGQDSSGSGLGLAIVQQATTRLGGRMELREGLNGRGCCFCLTVPIHSP
jgi:two-component system, OmpR family, sensor histidine kinase QseC